MKFKTADKKIVIPKGEVKILVKKEYTLHYTALCRGYVSKKATNGIKESYNGKFGEGYIIKTHNPNSTRYCYISYYVA